jgi:hypothetical protein
MAAFKPRQVQKALLKKGFAQVCSRHRRLFLMIKGKQTAINTSISHGTGEYDDGLLSMMAHELKLPKPRLVDLIKCPLTYEEYVSHLRQTGAL